MNINDFEGRTLEDKLRKAIDSIVNVNRTQTLYIDEGTNVRMSAPLVVNKNILLASTGLGRRSSGLVFDSPRSEETLVQFLVGNAAGMRGMFITTVEARQAERVVGLRSTSMSSSVFSNFEVRLNLLGKNSVGIIHERVKQPNQQYSVWGESVVFEKFDCRADHPVIIRNGDNITFRDFDITAYGDLNNCGEPTACFAGLTENSLPDFINISYGTCQGGDHALRWQANPKRTGSGLFLQNIRWEQGTDWGQPGWVVKVKRETDENKKNALTFGLEQFSMLACRNSQRKYSVETEGLMYKEPVITACYLPGKRINHDFVE